MKKAGRFSRRGRVLPWDICTDSYRTMDGMKNLGGAGMDGQPPDGWFASRLGGFLPFRTKAMMPMGDLLQIGSLGLVLGTYYRHT